MQEVEAILLAAGSSSRFGRPKQLEKYNGKTLLRNAVDICMAAGVANINVVLGAEMQAIRDEIEKTAVRIIHNNNWKKGMGTSLAVGLKEVLAHKPNTSAILISLVDQPLITAVHLKNLYREFKSGEKTVVATGFKGTFAPPLICAEKYFDEILMLDGEAGAKKIFASYSDEVAIIKFDPAGIDIDTEEDLQHLSQKSKNTF